MQHSRSWPLRAIASAMHFYHTLATAGDHEKYRDGGTGIRKAKAIKTDENLPLGAAAGSLQVWGAASPIHMLLSFSSQQ